jgi:phage tail-like protein
MKQSEIEQLLPAVFQRTSRPESPLSALLEVMEALHEPSEDVLARTHTYFHPYRTPDYFVPYLAGWVDLDRLLPSGEEDGGGTSPFPAGIGRLRELVAAAAFLSKWRGTARGLQRFLETATGLAGFEVVDDVLDPDGLTRPFHVLVRAPVAAKSYEELIERIVQSEKPAYVTCEVQFGPETPEGG